MSLFNRKPSVDDLLKSLNKEMHQTNWRAINIGLFFASLLVEVGMMQFDIIKIPVKVFFMVIIFALGWRIISVPKEKIKVEQPRIYPFMAVGCEFGQDKCPICGSFTKIDEKTATHYGVVMPAVACKDEDCEVHDPHLHAKCETCQSTFATHTVDKRMPQPKKVSFPWKNLDEKIAAHERVLQRLREEKEAKKS